jgi:hypothetical protein
LSVFVPPSAGASPTIKVGAAGTIGVRLVAMAGSTSPNPLARSYIVARLAPGAHLSRTVMIDDDSTSVEHVKLYVAAAKINHGQFVFAAGNTRNELTSWSSLSRDAVRLAPDSQVAETVTTRVPRDAQAGNDYAVLWAAVTTAPARGQGITMVSRVGVRMYVTVGPGGAAAPKFVLGTLRTTRGTSGQSVLNAQIHNSGASTLDLNGFLMLSKGPGGLDAGPFAAKLGVVLAPGSSEPISISLSPSFPRGPWRADLKITSGTLSRSTSEIITFPSNFAGRKLSQSRTLVMELTFILFALLVSASTSLVLVRRHQKLRVKPGRYPLPRT